MRTHLLLGLLCLVALSLRAEEKNGLSVSVQKTTLSRTEGDRSSTIYKIQRSTGLKATFKNVRNEPKPEGDINYSIIVERENYEGRKRYERIDGNAKLQPLKLNESTELILGEVTLEETVNGYYGGQSREDKLSSWRVIVTHDGKETIKMSSSASFDADAQKAAKSKTQKKKRR